jgi:large subunit ribosomal protein L1
MKHGKKYTNSAALLEKAKEYQPEEALALAREAAFASFDETVELHLRMDLDPRNATQQVRGVALMPHGLGKTVRVLVFAQGEAGMIAQNAGADYVGGDDLVKQIEGGWMEFDVAIATPDMMSKAGKLGKILGRRGLMPNPKAGTVVQGEDLPRVIGDSRKGRVEYKLDRTAIIHVPLGKASFETQQLLENLATVIEAIVKARPAGLKGNYIRSATVTTTMGPGIRLDLRTTLSLTTE